VIIIQLIGRKAKAFLSDRDRQRKETPSVCAPISITKYSQRQPLPKSGKEALVEIVQNKAKAKVNLK